MLEGDRSQGQLHRLAGGYLTCRCARRLGRTEEAKALRERYGLT
jgi:hypothetical protein